MLLDLIGAVISLLCTYLFIRVNPYAWLVTIAAACLNGILYWQKGIYADTLLEFFYFVSACYGWYLWRRGTVTKAVEIKGLTIRQGIFLFFNTLLFYTFIWGLLVSFTSSNVPKLDALTTSLSLVANWLMIHKILFTWIIWLVTDALYVYLYLHKQIPFHALLMLVYTFLAVVGYFAWYRRLGLARSE